MSAHGAQRTVNGKVDITHVEVEGPVKFIVEYWTEYDGHSEREVGTGVGAGRKSKVQKVPTIRKEVPTTAGDTSVVVVDDDDDDDNLGLHIMKGWRTSEAATDFASGFLVVGEGPGEAVADLEVQVCSKAPNAQD